MRLDVQSLSEDEFCEELKQRVGTSVVFNYLCGECSDEQSTEATEITEELIDEFLSDDSLTLYAECTSCGYMNVFLTKDDITGIESL
jgi:DNA-directed RNA polymerase subunit RPC12/RpoP